MIRVSVVFVLVFFNIFMGYSAPKPNIILMVADDMGLGDTSAYQSFTGNSDKDQIHTPNMERLARLGLKFTNGHSASSRCTASRYGLLTGRYPWRTRLKHWVLFGSQGDPLIEPDRPTIANICQSEGYRTGVVGKWHVGLRYYQSNGQAASGFEDADLTKPLHTSPKDHGFDYVRAISRSHPTSGPNIKVPKKNKAQQNIGPGHIVGRKMISATGEGRALFKSGPKAYDLEDLGRRNSEHVMSFLKEHTKGQSKEKQAFFLYYPVPANHTPYTPCDEIAGIKVKGASKNKAGEKMGIREDFIWENDVALGRILDHLEQNDDPRNPGHKLIDNTFIIFTSDNGAEISKKRATGPFRSNKGSCFEGGHRVPWIMAYKGKIKPNQSMDIPVMGTDFFATIAAVIEAKPSNHHDAEKGGEDSYNLMELISNREAALRRVLYHNDHKESKDAAVLAMQSHSPKIDGMIYEGQWKVFFKASLLREGIAMPEALYHLSKDPEESQNLIDNPEYKYLLKALSERAAMETKVGAQKLYRADRASVEFAFDQNKLLNMTEVKLKAKGLECYIKAPSALVQSLQGLGIKGNESSRVDGNETLNVTFNQDVIVEKLALFAGEGTCGGSYQMGQAVPVQLYCIDKALDMKNQTAELSDLGVLKKGDNLVLDASPYLGVEMAGSWTLQKIQVSLLYP